MLKFPTLQAEIYSLSVKGIPAETIDTLALELTAHLIDHDDALAAVFDAAIDNPVQIIIEHDLSHLLPITADFLARDWKPAPAETINAIAAKCFALAVEITRGAA